VGILKKIKALLFGDAATEVRDATGIYLYAKCSRCGAPIRVRVDKHHDLQRDYDTGEYLLRKEMMDGTCFTLMHATVRFDAAYRVIEQEIDGGEFISWDTYRDLTAPASPSPEAEDGGTS
jgi:hypothetical protein